jgi:hypothetical protein
MNLRKGQPGVSPEQTKQDEASLDQHAASLKEKEQKDLEKMELTQDAKRKLTVIADTEKEASNGTVKFIKGKLSPFIKTGTGAKQFDWYSIDFYKDIAAIFENSTKDMKTQIRAESRKDLMAEQGLSVPGGTAKKMSSFELQKIAREKCRTASVTIEGWVKATIKAYDKPGAEQGKIDLETFQAMIRSLPAMAELVSSEGPGKDVYKKLLWPKDPKIKERLNTQDYEIIVDLLSPIDIRTKDRGKMEATKAGSMIGIMNPKERFELALVFLRKRPKDDAKDFIDSLMATDMLTISQGEVLYEEGGLGKVDGEKMRKAQEAYRRIVKRTNVKLQANGYYNPARELLTGRNVGMVIAGAWGACTVVLNTVVHLMGDEKDWEGFITNPYIYLGAGAMGVSATKLSGGTVEGMLTKPGTETETKERLHESNKKLVELMGQYPTIERYLVEKRGAEHLFEVVEERKKEVQSKAKETGSAPEVPFKTTDALYQSLKTDTNADRRGALLAIESEYGDDGKDKIAEALMLMESLKILDQENLTKKNTSFQNRIKAYRKSHGIEA